MTTLTQQEQEKSLLQCKRKTVKKQAAKVVLCNPYEKYWPLLNEDDTKKLETILTSVLVFDKRKVKIPWKKLLNLPKITRKELIKERVQKVTPSTEQIQQRKGLIFGLNAVSRATQNQKISSCILAGDTKPLMIVEQITVLAAIKNIPVVVMPQFREFTCKILGFPCTSLAIKTPVEEQSNYTVLNDLITSLCGKFPFTSNITCVKPAPEKLTEHSDEADVILPEKEKLSIKCENIYLPRNFNGVKAFQPPILDPKDNGDRLFHAVSDFISLNVEKDEKRPNYTKFNYVHPNLKRLRKDQNAKLVKR